MTKLVGILNITPDSFSDGGKFDALEAAILQTEKMLGEGAEIIDIGAESTRPNATPISAKEEWQRLENILPEILPLIKKYGKKSSIDSYHFETIQKACSAGVDIINDVSGLVDENIIEFIAKNNLKAIVMHNLAIHANPDLIVNQHLDINREILSWAEQKINMLEQKSIKKSQLIFDPGIGFAKDAQQSIRIIKNIEEYKKLGVALYIGHSKKSFLDSLSIAGDRAQKTLEITKFLAKKQVDFLRVHDVGANFAAINSADAKTLQCHPL